MCGSAEKLETLRLTLGIYGVAQADSATFTQPICQAC